MKQTKCIRCRTATKSEGSWLCLLCRSTCPNCNRRPRAKHSVWCHQCINERRAEWRKENPGYLSRLSPLAKLKKRVRQKVQMAVLRGKLKKQPCEVCGSNKVEAHHHKGYSRETALDVRWFCKAHHPDVGRQPKEKVLTELDYVI